MPVEVVSLRGKGEVAKSLELKQALVFDGVRLGSSFDNGQRRRRRVVKFHWLQWAR